MDSQLQGGRATLASRRAPLSLEMWLREGGPADWQPVKLCTMLCHHKGPGPGSGSHLCRICNVASQLPWRVELHPPLSWPTAQQGHRPAQRTLRDVTRTLLWAEGVGASAWKLRPAV